MPFVTIWVDHDGIMLSEMNQTAKKQKKKNLEGDHSNVESKRKKKNPS